MTLPCNGVFFLSSTGIFLRRTGWCSPSVPKQQYKKVALADLVVYLFLSTTNTSEGDFPTDWNKMCVPMIGFSFIVCAYHVTK